MEELLAIATIGETADVTKEVCTAIERAVIYDDYLNGEKALLKANSATMIEGMSSFKDKTIANAIEMADSRRDNLYSSMIHFLKGYLLWKDDQVASAAELLIDIFNTHGKKIIRLRFERGDAMYDSLLMELENPEPATALATLNLVGLASDMKSAQTTFKALHLQSSELEAKQTNFVSPSAIKRNTQVELNDIANYLTTMSKAKPAIYGVLAANVAELIESENSKIRNRCSKRISETANS